MVNFKPHWLLSYGGTQNAGAEIWSNNIRFDHSGVTDGVNDVPSMLEDIADDLRTLVADSGSKWSSHVTVRWIKFNKIQSDGHYESDSSSNTLFLDGPDGITGSNPSPVVPPQITLAVTWLTDVTRGRASRGRIFPPMPAILPGPTGHVDLSTVQQYARAYSEFIANLGNWPGIDLTTLRPAVMSGLEPVSHFIERVSVGDVIDTMRSRRNALEEARSVYTV